MCGQRQDAGTVTFTPDNLQYYQCHGLCLWYLSVHTYSNDITTGCIAKDTSAHLLYQAPTAIINGPAGILCAGTPHTFTCVATPPNPKLCVHME